MTNETLYQTLRNRFLGKVGGDNCRRAALRGFRGCIELLETRTVLSATFGPMQTSGPDFGPPGNGSPSANVGPAHGQGNDGAPQGGDQHNAARPQRDYRPSSPGGTSSGSTVIYIVLSNPNGGAGAGPATAQSAPSNQPQNTLAHADAAAPAAQNLLANAQLIGAPLRAMTPPQPSGAALAAGMFAATEQGDDAANDMTLASESLNDAAIRGYTSELSALVDESEAGLRRRLTSGPTLVSDFEETEGSDSTESGLVKLSDSDELAPSDNGLKSLEALKRELQAVDKVLSELKDIVLPDEESNADATAADSQMEKHGAGDATPEKAAEEAWLAEEPAAGGMVLIEALGDANLSIQELNGILTADALTADKPDQVEPSVGVYQVMEVGGGTTRSGEPSATSERREGPAPNATATTGR